MLSYGPKLRLSLSGLGFWTGFLGPTISLYRYPLLSSLSLSRPPSSLPSPSLSLPRCPSLPSHFQSVLFDRRPVGSSTNHSNKLSLLRRGGMTSRFHTFNLLRQLVLVLNSAIGSHHPYPHDKHPTPGTKKPQDGHVERKVKFTSRTKISGLLKHRTCHLPLMLSKPMMKSRSQSPQPFWLKPRRGHHASRALMVAIAMGLATASMC